MSLRSTLAALAVALFPAIASAQIAPPTSGDVDPQQIVNILQSMGKGGELKFDKDGDPEVTGKTENINFVIFFYACEKKQQPIRCRSYQFWASFHNLSAPPTWTRSTSGTRPSGWRRPRPTARAAFASR